MGALLRRRVDFPGGFDGMRDTPSNENRCKNNSIETSEKQLKNNEYKGGQLGVGQNNKMWLPFYDGNTKIMTATIKKAEEKKWIEEKKRIG